MVPLASGKETPSFINETLAAFGVNEAGQPLYRVIWSARKRIRFSDDGELYEVIPEYDDPERWMLEVFVKETMSRAMWDLLCAPFLGEYSEGDYFQCDYPLPADWQPNEFHLQQLCQGLVATKGLTMKQRADARREVLEHKQRDKIIKAAQLAEDGFNSAQWGRIQQSASGPKNNFETVEDFERRQSVAAISAADLGLPQGFTLPKRGMKMFQPED